MFILCNPNKKAELERIRFLFYTIHIQLRCESRQKRKMGKDFDLNVKLKWENLREDELARPGKADY